ncbi:hypothetical protein A2U01_0000537 [Trifolium medium]|uniref:Uncharacterized protein n=1 Tax=Trifolium medium TaxID=97028 RepID=A0A392LXU0_9FABA|nr:hypothetical protein [Trifolium medium]
MFSIGVVGLIQRPWNDGVYRFAWEKIHGVASIGCSPFAIVPTLVGLGEICQVYCGHEFLLLAGFDFRFSVSSPFAKGSLVGDSVLADILALSLDFAVGG